MATTTNYSWTTPDDTDLVKDGAAAIRTLGSSADTTVKDLNPGTTAGDIDYYTSSTAKARVAIGTAGQILQVNSGATAPEWATPAGGGDIVKVASASFSAAASITVDNCFTSTYKRYLVSATFGASAAAATRIALRYSSGTESGDYYGSSFQYNRSNTLATFGSSPTAGFIPLTSGTGANVANIYFGKVGTGGSAEAGFYGSGIGTNAQEAFFFAGKANESRDYTGFIITAASGTFTGSYAVYGLKE